MKAAIAALLTAVALGITALVICLLASHGMTPRGGMWTPAVMNAAAAVLTWWARRQPYD